MAETTKLSRPERPLAEVNVLPAQNGARKIEVSFMPDPVSLVPEGETRAFLALDASASMRKVYGFGGPFGGDPNYVQGVARKLGNILCGVTKSGTVKGIYWAINPDGSGIEDIGEYDEQGWNNANISGPKSQKWGRGTKLLPAVRAIVEKGASGASWFMGVIITDGIIEDEADCINYCLQLGKDIAEGKRSLIKLVLIGIGAEVDEAQLTRFDNMFEDTGIDYDLWTSKSVASIQDEDDIMAVLFGELMNEEISVAATGTVETVSGARLANWPDGLPGKFSFMLPISERQFVIRVPNHPPITQDISEVLRP